MKTITTTTAPTLSEKLQKLNLFLALTEKTPSNRTLQKLSGSIYEILSSYSHEPVLNHCRKAALILVDSLDRLDLVTDNNFASEYFKWLPEFETQKECFEALNSQYKDAFGENKFQSFEKFRQYLLGIA